MRVVVVLFLTLFFTSSFNLVAKTSNSLVETYGKLPEKSLVVLSPSGNRIAYRDTKGGKDFVAILDFATKGLIDTIDVSDVKPNSIYFIDEDILIFRITENKAFGSSQVNISVAMAYNLNSKKIFQLLTAGKGIFWGQSQLGRILGISPDKKYVYMTALQSSKRLAVYKVSLEKKKKPQLLELGTKDTTDFFLDNNGNVLARERFNDRYNIHTVQIRVENEWKDIFSEETEIRKKSFVGFTPDKKQLVVIKDNDETGRKAYYTMSLADGSIEGPIFSQNNKDVESVRTDINRIVHGVRYSGFTSSYDFFDKKLNARVAGLQKALPNNSFSIGNFSKDLNKMILLVSGEHSTDDYYLYNKGKLSFFTASRPDIEPAAVHSVVEFSYQARDGMEIPALMTIPNSLETKNLPAIMMPHGGPESYDRKGFDYFSQYFASQGYLVIQPQFRGSSGFGPKHTEAGQGEWGRKMQDDLTDAVAFLVEKGKVNKDRVCIVGASYGGYAALAGASFTPELYKCVVSISGVSDVQAMMDREKRDFGSHHWVVSYWEKVISNGEFDDDHLEQISPINYVKNIKAPVLLIHGKNDKVVPVSQSIEMFDEMEDEDKDVTYIELKKGDHYLSNAKNRMKAMSAIGHFVKKHI